MQASPGSDHVPRSPSQRQVGASVRSLCADARAHRDRTGSYWRPSRPRTGCQTSATRPADERYNGAIMKQVRVGVGAGFSGDRLDAALPLVERGEIGYLVFECLAERTIALAQKDRLRDASRGYHPFLEERLRRVLAACKARGVKIV